MAMLFKVNKKNTVHTVRYTSNKFFQKFVHCSGCIEVRSETKTTVSYSQHFGAASLERGDKELSVTGNCVFF